MSITEMLVTIFIISLLYLLSFSSARGFSNYLEVHQAVRKATSIFRWARFQALEANQSVKVELHEKTIELKQKNGAAWETIRKMQFKEVSKLEMSSSPVFSPFGSVSPTTKLQLTIKQHLFQITVAITGRIQVIRIE